MWRHTEVFYEPGIERQKQKQQAKQSELCWEAYTNSDQTEGRGHDVTIAFFTRHEDAVRAAKRWSDANSRPWHPWMCACVREAPRPRVFESYADYEKQLTSDLKERALQKLTAEERKALGF